MAEDREQPGATAQESPDPAGARDPLGETIVGAVAQLQEIVSQFRTLIEVRVDRARITARETVFQLALAGLAFVACSTLIVFATFLIARGVAELLAMLSGEQWVGDFFGGLLILLVLVSLILGARGWLRRRGVAQLKRRYEDQGEGAGDA